MCIKGANVPMCRRQDRLGKHKMRQRGISLIELIMFIVIVSIALAGILLVMDTVTKGSVDPIIHKQALAIAESLLEEIELQDFAPAPGEAHTAVTSANRATDYHVIMDYNGFSMPSPPGIYSINDSTVAVSGLAGYSASAVVEPTTTPWNGIPAGSAVVITVAVKAPSGETLNAVGYRTAY